MEKSVLFVCMGNICRSPAAEGVLKHHVEAQRLTSKIRVDSAGTIGYHKGNPADARMRKAAAARGYRLDSVSRPVMSEDFECFDFVVAMDDANLSDLKAYDWGGAQVCLFSDFLSDDWPREVPDPYYGGDQGFETVLDMLEAGCPSLLERVLSS